MFLCHPDHRMCWLQCPVSIYIPQDQGSPCMLTHPMQINHLCLKLIVQVFSSIQTCTLGPRMTPSMLMSCRILLTIPLVLRLHHRCLCHVSSFIPDEYRYLMYLPSGRNIYRP